MANDEEPAWTLEVSDRIQDGLSELLAKRPELVDPIDLGIAYISANPLGLNAQHSTIRHLKGIVNCNREYRKLPDGHRIIYRTDEIARRVVVTYIGKHLSGKGCAKGK